MATSNSTIEIPEGFMKWEDIVGETIKLATSSFGIVAGLVGIVAAPVAVTLIDQAIEAYKEYSARKEFKAEERVFQLAEGKAAHETRKKAETETAERAYKKAEAAAEVGDVKKAVKYLTEAATEGSPEAMYALALSLLKEKDSYDNRQKIEMALRFASESGIDDAKLQLALFLYRNATTYNPNATPWCDHPSRPEYISLVKELAEKDPQKYLEAANLYGFELVADGKLEELDALINDVYTPDTFSSFLDYLSVLKRKPVEAVNLYYISTYTDMSEQEKKRRLKICAKKGFLPAINNLAMMYKKSDPDECRRLLIDAARKGLDTSLTNLVSTDRERFGDEGTINRYIAAIEKRDEIGVRALARMSGLTDKYARGMIESYWEKGSELRMTIPQPDGPDAVVGIDILGSATAIIVGTCAREARSRKTPFAEFLTKRANELGYLKPIEEGTYTILDEVPQKKTFEDPFARAHRNDPCPCGSGKKFKNCHGRQEQQAEG